MKAFHLLMVTGLVGLASPFTSQASDRKTFPATVCQVWGRHAELSEYLEYSQFGHITNTHPSQRIGVVCPVPRDNTFDSGTYVRVHYVDLNGVSGSTGQLGCRLRSNDVFGYQSIDSDAKSTSPSGGTDSGWWELQASVDSSEFSPSNYTLLCFIPPLYGSQASSIGSIIIEEP